MSAAISVSEKLASASKALRNDNPSSSAPLSPEESIVALPLAALEPSPYQPRQRSLDPSELEDLIASIQANGQLTPIIAQAIPGKPERYWVHSGFRRWSALRHLGADNIRATVRDLDERAARCLAVAANMGRSDLTAWEQAQALVGFMRSYNLGAKEAAQELGVTERGGRRLALIADASPGLQTLIRERAIKAKPAELLVRLEQQAAAIANATHRKKAVRKATALARQYVANKISSHQLETAIRQVRSSQREQARGEGEPTLLGQAHTKVAPKFTCAASADELALHIVLPAQDARAHSAEACNAIREFLHRLGIEKIEVAR